MDIDEKYKQNYKYFINLFRRENTKVMNSLLHKYNYEIWINDYHYYETIEDMIGIDQLDIVLYQKQPRKIYRIDYDADTHKFYCGNHLTNETHIKDVEGFVNNFYNKTPNCFKQLIIMAVKK